MKKKLYLLLFAATGFCVGNIIAQDNTARKLDYTKRTKTGSMFVNKSSKAPISKIASQKPLSNSYNIYSIILDGPNQVSYNPDINSIVFIHRQKDGGAGGTGVLTYDVSKDGGSTWNSNAGILTPDHLAGTANIAGNRYPNGTIWNPPANTNPDDAYIVGNGPTLKNTGIPSKPEDWGLLFQVSQKLDGTNNSEAYANNTGDSTDFHSYGLCNANGTLFSLSTRYNSTGNPANDTINYSAFYINKGEYNSSTNSFDWTVAATIRPDFYKIASSNMNFVTDWDIAFGPDGQTGYAIITAAVKSRKSVPKPYVYQTTDGGTTWAQLADFDFSSLSIMQQYIRKTLAKGLVRPYFSDIAAAVDSTNSLHLFSFMYSGFSDHPDSLSYIFSSIQLQSLMDVKYSPSNSSWSAALVDTISVPSGALGAGNDTLGLFYYPKISRTENGNRIFFTWQMSDPLKTTTNDIPDFFTKMYNVTDDSYSLIKRLTKSFGVFFPTVSPIAITGGDQYDYELPIVFAFPNPNNATLGAPDYYYLRHAGINDDYDGTDPTGVENMDKKPDIVNLFPNPGNGTLHLWLSSNETADVQVYNIVGQKIDELHVNSTKSTLNLNHLSEGIYFVKVIQGNTVNTKKIVITK